MGIFDIITGPLKDIITTIIGALDDDSPEKVQAKAELLKVQQSLAVAALDQENQLIMARARIIEAEAKSDHFLTSVWRPIVMLTFAAIVVYAAIFPSLFGLPPVTLTEVPDKFWTVLTLGLTGYIIGRSGEKIATTLSTRKEPE